jgi:RNA polymerase sigma-70 factor (ECF subfamily)
MGAVTVDMSETRLSLLVRVRNLNDRRSWDEFHAIYRPLIFGYLRGLGLARHDTDDLEQEVFWRLMGRLPTFELNRQRGRFRAYLWKLTYNTLVYRVRRKKVRDRAEDEWRRRFRESNESAIRKLNEAYICQRRRKMLEGVLPRVRERVASTAWACFERRLVHRRPAAEIAAELGITANLVHVNAHRVLQQIRRDCAEIEGETSDGCNCDPS